MKTESRDTHWLWADVISLIVIFTMIVVAVIAYPTQKKFYSDMVVDMQSGWQSENGRQVSLDKMPKGEWSLYHSLDEIDFSDKRLCMRSSDTFFELYADDVLIYSYEPEQLRILGDSYGTYIHMIRIPEGTRNLRMEMIPVFSDTAAYMTDVVIEDAGMYMGDVFKHSLPQFCLCMVMILYGLVMVYTGCTSKQLGENGTLNFLSLGAFSVMVGIWSANDTCILQVMTQSPEIIKLLTYTCLIFIAYLPVSFIASATNQKDTKLLPVLMLLVTINFVSTFVLTYYDISDFHYMLIYSHLIIIIAMLMTVFLMCSAIVKKTVEKEFVMRILIGLSVAILGVLIDLIRYRLNHNNVNTASAYTRVGVLVFIAMVGIHLIKQRNRFALEKERADMMANLAYTDGLTGLRNRAAFHEKENAIRENQISCVIVQLDINNLKTVNDVYGHAEGDRHILAMAGIIKDCFDVIGTGYRTGGDEFIVIVDRGDTLQTEAAIEKMQRSTRAYNEKEKPPVLLQVAYGYAVYMPQEGRLEEAEQLADRRMYEKKRKMKEESGLKRSFSNHKDNSEANVGKQNGFKEKIVRKPEEKLS